MISKKKILVTGGAGFVGTNLIESLLNENKEYEITSLDCYFTGTEDNHIINDRVNYVNGYTWEINEIFSENNFDVIFHFGTGYFGVRAADGGFSMEKMIKLVEENPFIKDIEVKL